MKLLVIRLSSLGDLILSTAGLAGLSDQDQVCWLTSSEYVGILKGHPRLQSIVGFDRRSSGLLAWLKLGLVLRREGFDQVVDLHNTLRTSLLRVIFMGVPWRSIKKRRWRRFGLFLLKRYWPRSLLPKPWVQEFSAVLSGRATYRPDFGFHLDHRSSMVLDIPAKRKAFFGVMPDSAWEGKCWPTDRYLELISSFSEAVPVILGTKGDLRSRELVDELRQRGLDFQDGRGLAWNELARVISGCRFLLSNDTGMVHFAEALGVPVVTIFGPTVPELGFSPHLSRSQVIQSHLHCRPCSSDGSGCYWLGEDRYKCLKQIEVTEVRGICRQVVRESETDGGVEEN
jgi:ADP-heptose:LPS heptosyltransferase